MLRVMENTRDRLVGKRWLLLTLVFFLIDQVSKYFIVSNLSLYQLKPIFPGLQLTLAYNRGVAFSWFNQQPEWASMGLFVFISAITLFIAWWLVRTPSSKKWEGICLSLILGGALGNLCDRIWHGHVIDFIDFYYKQWHWYTFNIADAFISIGAVMLLREVFYDNSAR